MSAEQNMSPQDYEMLSAYIDNELTDAERATLEQRLARDPFLQQELSALRSTVEVMQQLQPLKAPRDFTLTREMISTPKIIPFQSQRRSRAPYLSLVASILLMLFGVMFMLTELSGSESSQTDKSAPQPASASQGLDQTAIASAPTSNPQETDVQTGREVEEPELADTITDEDFAEDDATLNMQVPPADGRTPDDGGDVESFAVESSETTADSEASASGSLTEQESELTDDADTDALAGETGLFDTATEEEAPAPEAVSGANLRELQVMSDTADVSDEVDEAMEDDSSEPVADAVESRVVASPTATPPTPVPTRTPPVPAESTAPLSLDSIEIGIGFLVVGVLMLGASLVFIRRSRS